MHHDRPTALIAAIRESLEALTDRERLIGEAYAAGFRSISFRENNVALDVFTDLNKVRNIGIMAHIDAGKTTTTERRRGSHRSCG